MIPTPAKTRLAKPHYGITVRLTCLSCENDLGTAVIRIGSDGMLEFFSALDYSGAIDCHGPSCELREEKIR
jgi:hypothetical protein